MSPASGDVDRETTAAEVVAAAVRREDTRLNRRRDVRNLKKAFQERISAGLMGCCCICGAFGLAEDVLLATVEAFRALQRDGVKKDGGVVFVG